MGRAGLGKTCQLFSLAGPVAPCGRGAHDVINGAPIRSRPLPLHLSDEEMSLLINLSGPIAPAARPAFLDAVAAENRCEDSREGQASSTRRRGGFSGSSGTRRSCRTPRPCIPLATPPEALRR